MRTFLRAFIPFAFAVLALPAVSAEAVTLRADVRDLGRARASTPVTLALTLSYRHASELEQLVRLQGDRMSPLYRRFLTGAQFDDYFAPSAQSYARVQAALQRAGFHVTQTFANRTVLDASGPAGNAERYFSTQIRRVFQSGAGIRYASVDAGTLPAELHGIVSAVSGLDDLDAVVPLYRFAGGPGVRPLAQTRQSAATVAIAPGANLLADPGFESGSYAAWKECGTVSARITNVKRHTGSYAEFAGSLSGNEIKGDAGLCQAVTIPAGGVLSFWVYQGSTEPDTRHALQWALLMTRNGTIVDSLYATVNNTGGWQRRSYNVGSFAGKTLYLYFGVRGDGRAAHHTYQFVDDVDLPNAAPAPTPPPTSPPTSVPTTPPTSPPTAIPTAPPGSGGGQSIGGPLMGPGGGYGPLATAQGYDLPVQHGFNGSGRSAGVVIWGDYSVNDLAIYEQEWGIVRTGLTSKVAVDGGATFNANPSAPGNASVEAELDVETIEGIAPGANVVVYEFPVPTGQEIIDAYNAVVTANTVDVVNSSFGGCESAQTGYALQTDQIALQGAAKGITFSASSGDSGSNECGSNSATGVSAPAGGPHFVSVGGTSLAVGAGGGWAAETVWNLNGGAGGGGVSSVFPVPAYQQGVLGVVGAGRNQPDISLAADPYRGTSLYFSGAWYTIGGTSWASPIFTAYLTEVAQEHGTRAGFVTSALYGAYASSNYTYYHDVTLGNNYAYAAHGGYDQASGIGSLSSGYALATQLP